MSPPLPPEGTRLRLFLTSRRHLDGTLGVAIGNGSVTFLREGREIYERIDWGEVYSYHRLDAIPRMMPTDRQMELPLEGKP